MAEKKYESGIEILKIAENKVQNNKKDIQKRIINCQNAKDSSCIKYFESKLDGTDETLQDIHSINAELYYKIKDYPTSETFFNKSLAHLKTKNNTRSYAKELFGFSTLQLKLGNQQLALELSHQVLNIFCKDFNTQNIFAIPSSQQLIADIWVVEALYQKAEIFKLMMRNGELPNTKYNLINEAYDKAIFCLDLTRENYINDESKYNLTTTMSKLFDDAFEFNFQTFNKNGSAEVLEKLFEISQLKKAFVFKSSISLRNAMLDNGVPQDITDKYFDIKYEVNLSEDKISDKVDSLNALEKIHNRQFSISRAQIYF